MLSPTTRTALIFGAGGHARVIASLLDRQDVRFVDKAEEEAVCADAELMAHCDAYLGIGNNGVRISLFHRLKTMGVSMPAMVARGAVVAPDVEIGAATVIFPGAVVMTGAKIGDNCVISVNASVDHDCVVGNHTFIAPGVIIPGDVKIGDNCFLGLRCSVFPGVTIGHSCVVRAGSLVTKNVPTATKVGGIPATVIPWSSEG